MKLSSKLVILSSLAVATTALPVPSWWISRGVVNQEKQPDDFAVINQGQLKNLAKAAYLEMQAQVGAGEALDALIQGWQSTSNADDYSAVTVGQLKFVARKFYDRLLVTGQIGALPLWLGTVNGGDDYAAANIGQAKQAFSFSFSQEASSDHPSMVAQYSQDGPAANLTGIEDEDRSRFDLPEAGSSDEPITQPQRFSPDALGRLGAVIHQSAHQYTLDNEGNIELVNP